MSSPVLDAEYDDLDWLSVNSSAVEAVAYVPRFGRLYVRWHQQPGARYRTYRYHNVPPRVWDQIQTAGSVGEFVNRVVKRFGYDPVE